jgi:2,3-bisphosphoglycerate-independent phosphoglycerate mutase
MCILASIYLLCCCLHINLDGDTLFFFDFRADRMRQITQAFGITPAPFEVEIPKDLYITTFTKYKSDYPFSVAFPPQTMDDVLAEWLAKQKIPQCHIAGNN